jgi:hypothetical protein
MKQTKNIVGFWDQIPNLNSRSKWYNNQEWTESAEPFWLAHLCVYDSEYPNKYIAAIGN